MLKQEATYVSRAETADLARQQTALQLDAAQREIERLTRKIADVTAEMRAACERDMQGVIEKSKQKEAALVRQRRSRNCPSHSRSRSSALLSMVHRLM